MPIRRAIPALALAAVAAAALAAGSHSHWTYEGNEGPEHWSDLSEEFSGCKGHQQSPINLTNAREGDNEDISLSWTPFRPQVTNNGHTIQAVAAGDNTTKSADKVYTLQQIHFHHPSEHKINGEPTSLEAHFVNKAADGKLLVLGVMIEQGKPNPEIAKLWAVAPQRQGDAQATSDIDFRSLVPADGKFFHYAGSLTTPPCSEIVDWVVFVDPITASAEQIDAFAKLYPGNSRPVQELHERTIVFGR